MGTDLLNEALLHPVFQIRPAAFFHPEAPTYKSRSVFFGPRFENSSLFGAVLRLALLYCALLCGNAAFSADEAVRPDVGKLLNKAQELHGLKEYAQALGQIAEAEKIGTLKPLERFYAERMRAMVLISTDDQAGAAKTLEAALASERGGDADRLAILENLVLTHYRAKAYTKSAAWAERYLAQGGTNAGIADVQIQALYLAKQYPSAAALLDKQVSAIIAAKRTPTDAQLRMLASAYQQNKDYANYLKTAKIIARYYPKPEIWKELIYRVLARNDFPDVLEIDSNRLLRATKSPIKTAELLEQAQLTLATGYAGEAFDILSAVDRNDSTIPASELIRLDQMLAKVTRMRQEDEAALSSLDARMEAAKEPNLLVNAALSLSFLGNHAHALAMVDRALAKPGLRQPEMAKLRKAYVLARADKREEALALLDTISGTSPEAELAGLWRIFLQSSN